MSSRNGLPLSAALSRINQMAAQAAEAASEPTTEEPDAPAKHTVTLTTPSPLGREWKRVLEIAYGNRSSRLGVSMQKDGTGLGPSYGVQTPDQTWWIADAAKRRLAHFSGSGKYLGEVRVPRKFLERGEFRWRNPVALANGSVVLTRASEGPPALLVVSPTGHLSQVRMKQHVEVAVSDGTYFFGTCADGRRIRLDPISGKTRGTTWFQGQNGHKFQILESGDDLVVKRPGRSVRIRLAPAENPKGVFRREIEYAVGREGRLWVLVRGAVSSPGSRETPANALFSVSKTGRVATQPGLRELTGAADPADGHRLGITFGSKQPWLMFVDADALRVYQLK